MKARTAIQITLSPADYRRAKRLAKRQGKFISTFLREVALERMFMLEEAFEREDLAETMRIQSMTS
jgi:predicted DNA-binding protein